MGDLALPAGYLGYMARTTRTLLLRHGEVDRAWRQRIYGGHDVPLSERGLRQSRAAAKRLSLFATGPVVTSGLSRTRALGELLAGGRPTITEPALTEIDRGAWLGRSWEELDEERQDDGGDLSPWRAWWINGGRTSAPGGESLLDLWERVLPTVEQLVRTYPGQTLTLVAHSWVQRLLVAHALGLSVEGTMGLNLPTAGLAVLDWHAAGRVELAGLRPGDLPPLS